MIRRLLAALAVAAVLGLLGASAAAARPPRLSAPAAILVEGTTGRVVYARHPDQKRYIASLTKMMTALVTLEHASVTRVIRVPAYPAMAAESQIGLRPGERMTVADLLRGLFLPSANDAANALAVRIGGSRGAFVRLMNREAVRLHLRATHFTTPVGLDTPGNHSTPRDLATLARELRRRPFARVTMNRPSAVLRSGAHRRVIVNRNTLVRVEPWVDGVKTGHTNGAGYDLVGSGTIGDLNFVSVVLDTSSESARDANSLALLRWGFRNFRWSHPARRGAVIADPRVDGRTTSDGTPETVPVVAARDVRRLVRRGARVRTAISVPSHVRGPLRRGAVVGHVVVRAGGRVLARVDAVTARKVAAPPEGALGWLTRPGTLLLVGGVLVLTLLGVRSRRRLGRHARRRTGPETA